jgi:hypothetical protein
MVKASNQLDLKDLKLESLLHTKILEGKAIQGSSNLMSHIQIQQDRARVAAVPNQGKCDLMDILYNCFYLEMDYMCQGSIQLELYSLLQDNNAQRDRSKHPTETDKSSR